MNNPSAKISVRGKMVDVPLIRIGDIEIITHGRHLKTASIRDEDYCESDPAENPAQLIELFKSAGGSADIFTFSQRITRPQPEFDFPLHYDNAAVIPLGSYDEWWEGLAQIARRNVRLASKRGVTVDEVPFDDKLVEGIVGIYNESPVRQGRRFWHYGKRADAVKRENGTFSDRSTFIGAFHGNDLIGFIKIVHVGEVASIMQILTKTSHFDKRPTNALIAKAVEIAAKRKMKYLQYCKFVYHGDYNDPLTDFKRRNGFQELRFPQYFVPLTTKGRLAVALNVPLGPSGMLPKAIVLALLSARAKYHAFLQRSQSLSAGVAQS
jgi:hypothetical protein